MLLEPFLSFLLLFLFYYTKLFLNLHLLFPAETALKPAVCFPLYILDLITDCLSCIKTSILSQEKGLHTCMKTSGFCRSGVLELKLILLIVYKYHIFSHSFCWQHLHIEIPFLCRHLHFRFSINFSKRIRSYCF